MDLKAASVEVSLEETFKKVYKVLVKVKDNGIGISRKITRPHANMDDTSGDELLKRADEALYQAKALGRNQISQWEA